MKEIKGREEERSSPREGSKARKLFRVVLQDPWWREMVVGLAGTLRGVREDGESEFELLWKEGGEGWRRSEG